MRTHREPSLEGCAAKMQLGRSSFEARKSSHLRMTVRDLAMQIRRDAIAQAINGPMRACTC